MLTSSIAWMGWTFIFFRAVCSFLSSVPEDLWTFLVFLLGVPLPLFFSQNDSSTFQCPEAGEFYSGGGVETNVPCSHDVSSLAHETRTWLCRLDLTRTNSHLRLHALELLLVHIERRKAGIFWFRMASSKSCYRSSVFVGWSLLNRKPAGAKVWPDMTRLRK